MKEAITMFNYSRTSTLILLKKIDESVWDVQPEGFPNTIRWNAGHIYSTAEDYLTDADENYKITLPAWNDYFLDGTRPSEWTGNVPTASEIIEALEEQKERISNHFKDILSNQATIIRDINGTPLDTVESSLQFVTWHEGIHIGVTNALSKIV